MPFTCARQLELFPFVLVLTPEVARSTAKTELPWRPRLNVTIYNVVLALAMHFLEGQLHTRPVP